MPILLILLLFLILLALAFVVSTNWPRFRARVLPAGIIALVAIVGAVFTIYYRLTYVVRCVPDCVGAKLVNRNFEGFVFNDVNFVEADFTDSSLADAQLRGADLSGAWLLNTNLENADLQNALLLGATLTGANLAGATLTGADLRGADLTGADLTGVDLTQTRLSGAILSGAELVVVDLTSATVASLVLDNANLQGALLVNADLAGADLSHADVNGARLAGSTLRGAWLNTTSLIGADLNKADLSGASLIGAVLASADLGASSLVGANLVGVNFKGVNLNAATLAGATIQQQALLTDDLRFDPVLQELNEQQRSKILVDANLDGATFDAQTVWPDSSYAEAVAAANERLAVNTTTDDNTIRVGILHSLTGDLANKEVRMRDAELLAIDEINAAGGVLGKQLEPLVEDGASDPAVFAAKARNLLEKEEVTVIFGGWNSSSRQAILPVVEALHGLLFYPGQTEGFEQSPNVFYIGPTPAQQILPAVDYLLGQGRRRLLLVGSDEPYAHTINAIIKAQLAVTETEIAGEVYLPLGETDFSQIMDQLQAAPPDAIFNSLQGASNGAFFTQFAAAGFLAAQLPVLSVNVTEAEIQEIGTKNLADHLISATYYQTTDTPENFAFVTAFNTLYGEGSATSEPIEASYTAVYLWKLLVEAAQSTDVTSLRRAASATPVEFAAPQGLMRIDGASQSIDQIARIGQISAEGFIQEVWRSEAPLEPDPFLTRVPWAANVRQAIENDQ